MAVPGRAAPSADFSTNQVCWNSFHWSFCQSPEGQAGMPEPAVPWSCATCSAPLRPHGEPQREEVKSCAGEVAASARANAGLRSPHGTFSDS